jgi:carboxypeptidase Q
MKRIALALIAAASASLYAQTEKIDYQALGRIRDEGLNRSQVMDHLFWLADVYGPRLTGTPQLQQASEWVMKKFTEWGLSGVKQERWAFGKGWSLVRFSAHMIEPSVQPIVGLPHEWSAATSGAVTAEVVRATLATDEDLARYRGKLAGKIVLTQPLRRVRMLEGPIILRMTDEWTAEAESFPIPGPAASGRGGQNAAAFRQKLADFLVAEGVVATFDRGADGDMSAGGSNLTWEQQRPDGGTIFPVGAGARDAKAGRSVPEITIAVEHYNRMVRLLERNIPVKVELNVQTRFYDEADKNGINTLGELQGSDLADQVVLLGAHLDSHPYATGATDNATGVAAVMEALRILKTIGVKPRRTIRAGLWGGEEQGLLGSRAYVRDHLGDVETMALKPEHAKLAAYFNSDNGTGRVRGIWLQGNLAAGPIFEQWMAPLKDLGVTILGPRSVSATDHVSFDNIGVPAFQFLVDRLDYNSRTHHSNMDTFDRVQRDDMVQQATVIAVFAYDAAMRDEKLPRKALPAPRRTEEAER